MNMLEPHEEPEKERPAMPFDPNDFEHQQDRYEDFDHWIDPDE